MSEFSFRVTDKALPGKTRGRGPSPFVEPLRQSYAEDYAKSGKWFEFEVNAEDVDKVVQRIRTAGQTAKTGTEVRTEVDADGDYTGVIQFRGVTYVERPRRANGQTDQGEGGSETSGGQAVPVSPSGEPFEWDDDAS